MIFFSMDICRGTKLNRNTIQATGCQDMSALGHILQHLLRTYHNQGFEYDNSNPFVGFVGDVVLANLHFTVVGVQCSTPTTH